MKTKLWIPFLSLPLFAFVSCEQKSPAEKAADDMKDAVEEVGDAVEDATD